MRGEARRSICGRTGIPIAVLGGTDDVITREELQEWQQYAIAPVTVQMLPGDHFFLNTGHEAVCATLRARIADTFTALGQRPRNLEYELAY